MKSYDPHALADQAVAGRAERPATTIVHDSADVRLVVFRIEPGQYEPHEPHAMRALDERFVLLATIAPRPGSRL